MTSKHNRSIKLKLEATLPMPEMQAQMLPPKPPCGNCGTCGASGEENRKQTQHSVNPLLHHAGTILIKILSGQYTAEQIKDGFGVLDELLRHHYGKND